MFDITNSFWREQRAVVYVEFLNVVLKEGSLWATVIDANGLAIISKVSTSYYFVVADFKEFAENLF